jgi:hypothetical protein
MRRDCSNTPYSDGFGGETGIFVWGSSSRVGELVSPLRCVPEPETGRWLEDKIGLY